MKQLDPGQALVACTKCVYFEVWEAMPNFFWCKACGCGHCVFCKNDLPHLSEEEDDDADEPDSKQAEMMMHFVCAELGEAKDVR
jgi:hypothetical protein